MMYPYGVCECQDCVSGINPCQGRGPAAFEVTRNGVRLKVCTFCDIRSDQDKRLLVKPTDDLGIFQAYDDLGHYCLVDMLKSESPDEADEDGGWRR